jgi:hypothetical protein
MSMKPRWNYTEENGRALRKVCPIATLSTTNPTWTDPGANMRLRGERPVTNPLRHGMAYVEVKNALGFGMVVTVQLKPFLFFFNVWYLKVSIKMYKTSNLPVILYE